MKALFIILAAVLPVSFANADCDQCSAPYPYPGHVKPPSPLPASLIFLSGSHDFALSAVGSINEQTITLSNVGEKPAQSVSAESLSGDFDFKGHRFPGKGGTCNDWLVHKASCTIVVTFSPKAVGRQADTLQINYDNDPYDRDQTKQVATLKIGGEAAEPALIKFKDAPGFDYGSVKMGWAVDRIFWIENTGGVPATGLNGGTGSTSHEFKGGTFPGLGGTCSKNLNSGQPCSIVMTYAPDWPGTDNSFIGFSYYDGANDQWASCQLSGVGQK